jgi:hypothetical protein
MRRVLSGIAVLAAVAVASPALKAQPGCTATKAIINAEGKVECTDDAGSNCVTCPQQE